MIIRIQMLIRGLVVTNCMQKKGVGAFVPVHTISGLTLTPLTDTLTDNTHPHTHRHTHTICDDF